MSTRRASPAAPSAVAGTADRLHSAAIHLLRLLRREDDAGGISAPRLSALSVLVFGGPLTVGELASAEQVRPPTMTRLVQALAAEGLVTRETDPADGRVIRVRATAKGKRLLQEGRARRIEALARRLTSLSTDDLATLDRAVEIVGGLVRAPE
jgi:DNA-binding MarR family transcriptional regulator